VLALDADMSERPSDAQRRRRRRVARAFTGASAIADGMLEQRAPGIARRLSARERRVEFAFALSFLATAAGLVVAWPVHWRDPAAAVLLTVTYAMVARVRFQVGPGLVRPTELVFVPMLFLLPAPAVPLLVAAGSVLSVLPEVVGRRTHAERLPVAVADSWHAVGPAIVVSALAPEGFAAPGVGVFALALLAQFGGDFLASTLREWAGDGISPRALAPVMAIVYLVDALLSPIGLLAVLASQAHPQAYLLAAAPGALLALIARERRRRIEQELTLARAYRRSTRLLDLQAEDLRREVGRLQGSQDGGHAVTLDRKRLERLVLKTTVDAVQADSGRLSECDDDGSPRVRMVRGELNGSLPALCAAEAVLLVESVSRQVEVGGVNALSFRLCTLAGDERAPRNGFLTLSRAGAPFAPAERELLAHLVAQAAVSLENLRLQELMRKVEEELRTILEGVADGVTAEDPAGRLVYANAAAASMLECGATDEAGVPLPAARLPGPRALAGERPEPVVVAYRRPGTDKPRCARVKAAPVFDEGGRVRLAISVIEDITDIKQAEEAQRFLAESSRLLAGSLQVDETLPALARLVVSRIADGCTIHLCGQRGVSTVAIAHADPAKQALAEALEREYPPDVGGDDGLARVLRAGRPELDADGARLAASPRDDRHHGLLEALGTGSAMIVPMRARDQVVGAITLVTSGSGRRFGPDDLALAQDLALRAGTTVDNARLYRTRAAIAQTLQASLMPPELPDIPQLETAALYRAAGEGHEVGGDFYDLFSTAPEQWFVVMGDVCGKGAAAAAVTALARYTIRAAVVRHRSPAGILGWLNDAMLRQRTDRTRFATVACARIDLARDGVSATVASGGHPCPRVLRRTGLVETLGNPGTALGIVEKVLLEDRVTRLSAGDALIFYTDGLTEAGAPKRVWTPDQLDAVVGTARHQPARAIVETLARAALGDPPAPLRDDIALLAARLR
jgi:PAS domain-containing protein